MGDLGELNRHDRALSQTRALTILCRCMAQSLVRNPNNQRDEVGTNTQQSLGLRATHLSAGGRNKTASPQSDKITFTYSRRPIFHTYILTWL